MSAGTKQGLVLDEHTFQQLLGAAYVVQQHNDSLRGKETQANTKAVLAEIAEIQSLVRNRGLDDQAAAGLIVDRLRTLTGAAGISISLISDGFLQCLAESGMSAGLPGSCIASHSLVATERLRTGEIFDSSDAQSDIRLDIRVCRELGVGSLIALPVQKFEELTGVMEVRWSQPKGFREPDVRACRLMAELIASMLERKARSATRVSAAITTNSSAEPPPRSSPADSDATPPPSGRLTSAVGTQDSSVQQAKEEPPEPQLSPSSEPAGSSPADLPDSCRVCGRSFAPNEAFCGHCSMPRVASAAADGLQSKWASLWYMQNARATVKPGERIDTEPLATAPAPTKLAADLPPPPNLPVAETVAKALSRQTVEVAPPLKEHVSSVRPASSWSENDRSELEPLNSRAPERPLAAALDAERFEPEPSFEPIRESRWSETLDSMARKLRRIRIRVRLADAVLFGVAAALGLGVMTVAARPRYPGLSWSESLMVDFGLATAPHVPAAAGNPDARVWVDEHTGLYYCSGTDLYGKTPGGRFSSQLRAQSQQIISASGKNCE